MKQKALVVINPVAGGGKGVKRQDAIVKKLEEIYNQVDVVLTKEKNDGIQIGRKACKDKVKAIYCVGGDGTVQEVVQGIAEQPNRPTLGIVPLGTYNALARMLKLPLQFEKNIQRLDQLSVKKIDIGKINDSYFLFLVSIGKLAEPFHQVTSEQKGKFGIFSYFYEGLKRIPEDRPYTYRITTGEETFEVESSLVMFSLSNYIGDIKFSGIDIRHGDGKGHLLMLKDVDFFQKTQVLINALAQKAEASEQVISLITDEILIEVKDERPPESDIDGDLGPEFPLNIKVLKEHIEVFVP